MLSPSLTRPHSDPKTVRKHFRRLDGSKPARFLTIAVCLTPLIALTKWFDVLRGTFTYDDLEILSVARNMPVLPSLTLLHGDATIPMFRMFFLGMYTLFGVNELYWNLYFLLLMLAVNLAALAILVALGANLVVSALFYVICMSASVW